jgi:hypothetical protein
VIDKGVLAQKQRFTHCFCHKKAQKAQKRKTVTAACGSGSFSFVLFVPFCG